MPGSQDVIQIFGDINGDIEGVSKLREALVPLKNDILEMSKLSIISKTVTDFVQFRTVAAQLTDAMGRIKQMEIEIEALRTKHSSNQRARTDEEIREQLRVRDANKARVDQIKAEDSAYKQLTLEYRKAAAAAKDLAAQYGVNSKQAKEAAEQANHFATRLKEVDSSVGQNQRHVGSYTESLKEFGKELLLQAAAFIGIYQAFEFFKDSVKEIINAQQQASKLNNILTNLGRREVFQRLNSEAEKLAKEFGTIKSEDLVQVFDKLVVYGKLTENQIRELTPVIINFAAQTGQTLEESTSLILKALEGNSRGLKEFGINIKRGSTEAENFGIIMDSLAPRVEGAAKAFGETTQGQIKKTTVEIDELKKEIGEELLPAVKSFFEFVSNAVKNLKTLGEGIGEFFGKIRDITMNSDMHTIQGQRAAAAREAEEAIKKAGEKEIEDTLEKDKFIEQNRQKQVDLMQKYYGQLLSDKDAFQRASDAQDTKAMLAMGRRVKLDGELIARAAGMVGQGDRVLGFGNQNGGDKKDDSEDTLRDIEDFSEAFKKQLEAIQEFAGKGVEKDAIHKELDDARKEYHKFYTDIEDLRKKDEAKITKEYQDGHIERQQYLDLLSGVDELAAKNQAKAAEAIQANLKAIREKYDRQLLEDHKKNGVAGQLSKTASNFFADNVAQAQIDELNDPTSANKKNVLQQIEKDQEFQAKKKLDSGAITEKQYDEIILSLRKKLQADLRKVDADSIKSTMDDITKYANEAEKLIGGLVNADVTRKKNALQQLEDMQQKAYENEIARINGSTLNEQQKAAKLIILEKQRQSEKEQNERKQRQIDQERARFEKAASIVKVIENTAVGVTSALAGDPYTAAARVALVAAIGAAELAVAIAQPIPKFEKGTKSSPEGLAIVHPGELRIDPSGEMSATPDKPSLTYLKKGTQIISANEVNQMLMNAMIRDTAGMIEQKETNKNIEDKLDIVAGLLQTQTMVLKKKKFENHNHFDSSFSAHIDKYVRN